MKKSIFLVLSFALLVGVVPPKAQAFELQNIFSSFTNSIQQRMQRAYLALPGNKDGRAVLQQSFAASENITSFTSETKVVGALQADGQEALSFDFTAAGPIKVVDIYDPKSAQQEMNFAGGLKMEGMTLSANADVKMNGGDTYFKLNEVPAALGIETDQIKGKWIKAPKASESAMVEGETVEIGQPASTLTDEQKQKLKELYVSFLNELQVGEAKRETVDGVKAFVVEVTMTPEQIVSFAKQAAEIEGRSVEEIAQMTSQLEQVFSTMNDVTSTIVIDRSTFYTTKVIVPLSFDLSQLNQDQLSSISQQVMVPVSNWGTAERFEVMVTIRMSKFNEPYEFTVPSDAQPIEEIFSGFMPSGAMPASAGGPTGVGAGAVTLPPAALQNSRRPAELPELTAEEEAMLKQYGIDPATLR